MPRYGYLVYQLHRQLVIRSIRYRNLRERPVHDGLDLRRERHPGWLDSELTPFMAREAEK